MNRYAKLLAMLYTDRMDVYPMVTETGADGVTRTRRGEAKVAGAPCRISYRGRSFSLAHDNPRPGVGENPTERQPLIFCAPEEPIAGGDYVVATRSPAWSGGEPLTVEGYIGAPNLYMGSAQFLLFSRKQG